MRDNSKVDPCKFAEFVLVYRALSPPNWFDDYGTRLTADARRDRQEEAIAALNRCIVRILGGADVLPSTRRELCEALTEERVRLIPRHAGRGRRTNKVQEMHIARALHDELKKQSRKRAYGAVGNKFGLTTRRLEQIWKKMGSLVKGAERIILEAQRNKLAE
jgi:hypothetical protein